MIYLYKFEEIKIMISFVITLLMFLSFVVYGIYEKRNHKDLSRTRT